MSDNIQKVYTDILKKELVPSIGCTEPSAIAFCAAKAKSILKKIPTKVIVEASGNVIKNAKSVVVPNTNGMKGIEVAVAMGIIAGDYKLGLEVVSNVSDDDIKNVKAFLKTTEIDVKIVDNNKLLDFTVSLVNDEDSVSVRIINTHTNIVWIKHNEEIIFDHINDEETHADHIQYNLLNMKDIYEFASTANMSELKDVISKQIKYNTAISNEGLNHNYGANIGSILLKTCGNDVRNRSKSKAAAGSDARMNGSNMPVIINSGSGNQGMTASLPVIEFAKELKVEDESLYRALILSNLIAIYQKSQIGLLSAYCGAVSAGAAAGAAITFLKGGNFEDISQTLINGLAIASGIICDGAKSSCAAKIAISVDAGILGSDIHLNGHDFYAGDGIVGPNVEDTIRNIGLLGRVGMKETDKEILCLMTCFD